MELVPISNAPPAPYPLPYPPPYLTLPPNQAYEASAVALETMTISKSAHFATEEIAPAAHNYDPPSSTSSSFNNERPMSSPLNSAASQGATDARRVQSYKQDGEGRSPSDLDESEMNNHQQVFQNRLIKMLKIEP